jgi:hypothetical protein
MVAFEIARLDDPEAMTALQAATRRRFRSAGNNRDDSAFAPSRASRAQPRTRPAVRERLHIRVPAAHAETNLLRELKALLARHQGEAPVLLHLWDGKSETNLALPRAFAVVASEALCREIEAFLGEGAVWRETL